MLNNFASSDPKADLGYYQVCLDNKIVPTPIFTQIHNQTFSLVDYYISKEIALALE